MVMPILQDLSEKIIGPPIQVHQELEPGLLESACGGWLCCEFSRMDLSFRRQGELPVGDKSNRLNCRHVVDIIAEEAVLLGRKSADELHPTPDAQLITYLELRELKIGLLIDFNVPVLTADCRRRVEYETFLSVSPW